MLTAMPNYPAMRVFDDYRGRWSLAEKIDGVEINRSWIFVSRSPRMIPRLLNYFSFVLSSLISGLRARPSDYLICESPPLFLGISAVAIAKKMKARLVFNVSDLWPESAVKLDIVGEGVALRAAYRLEAWIYRKAHIVTGQTMGIVRDIEERFPSVRTFWLPNGADLDVVDGIMPDSGWLKEHQLEGKKIFVYAGILGHAQGLEVIIRAGAGLRGDESIAIVLIGDGPLKCELLELNRTIDARVTFIPSVPKEAVMAMIASAYASIVPLKRLDLFKGAIPSKIFDPLAVGVPVILGVEGEAKELFIDQAKAGIFFEPESVDQLAMAIRDLTQDEEMRDELGSNGKIFVRQRFDRRAIARGFLERLSE